MERDEKGKFIEQIPALCPWCGGRTMVEDGWKGGGYVSKTDDKKARGDKILLSIKIAYRVLIR